MLEKDSRGVSSQPGICSFRFIDLLHEGKDKLDVIVQKDMPTKLLKVRGKATIKTP